MKTKLDRLKETIKDEPLRGGEFLDLYNRTLKRDGICGTINALIDQNGNFYVVVDETDNSMRHQER